LLPNCDGATPPLDSSSSSQLAAGSADCKTAACLVALPADGKNCAKPRYLRVYRLTPAGRRADDDTNTIKGVPKHCRNYYGTLDDSLQVSAILYTILAEQ